MSAYCQQGSPLCVNQAGWVGQRREYCHVQCLPLVETRGSELKKTFFFFFQNLNILLYKVIPKIVLHFFTIYFNSRTFVKAVHFRNPGRNSTSYRLFKYCLQKVLKKKQNRGVQMNLFTKRKQSNRCRKQTYGYQGIRAGGINWETGTVMYVLLY